MINLYEQRELIELLNIVIIISIPIISMILYRISKNYLFSSILLIYILELFMFIFISNYSAIIHDKIDILNLVSLIYILKPILFISFSKYIKFSIKMNSFIIIGNILAMMVLNIGYEFSMIVNIVLNIIIIDKGIICKIKGFNDELQKNRHKLRVNKKYISKAIDEIASEYELQNQYKNEILRLNDKVSRSIKEVNTPIFLLNTNREYIYSNKSFEDMIKDDGLDISNFNIIKYLKRKFVNSDEILNHIQKIKSDVNHSINLKTYNDEVYRFICATDIINDQGIILCILNDITQSTIIQNKLKESEERYRKLMDILNDGVIIHNMNTISYINNRAIELFSLDNKIKKVLLIDDVKAQISKKFRQEFLKNINLVQVGKKDKTITKVETEDGKILEFVTTSLKLNESQMMLSLAIDITTLETAMDELEQSEKTYKLLLQTLPEGVVIIDKRSKNHIYRNKAMIKLLKTIGADRLNDIVKDYINKDQYGKFRKITVGENERYDIAIAIVDMKEEGQLLGVVRTLQHEHKAEKMAEKLSEIKDKYRFKTEFLTAVTKDIKKPISIISRVNDILEINRDKYDSEYIDNYTRLVRQNCYRLIRLLNNVEEIEEIDSGKCNINLQKTNIVNLVKNIVEIAKSYTDEKGLKIIFESNLESKYLIIDKDKMEKLILNLLSNSIKFTDPGGKIRVSVNVINDETHISVEDSGVGIPNDKINVIFEDFEQVDRTLSRGAEGTGIGLSLVKKLADMHNGKINVKSKIGEGSKFELVLKDSTNSNLIKEEIDSGNDFIDKEKMDIEFSDIYFNLNS